MAGHPTTGRAIEPPAGRCVIWCLTDGRPGHRSQMDGLIQELARTCHLQAEWICVDHVSRLKGLTNWACARFPDGETFPDPDLIVAAGHATHLPALAARRARGGRLIILMRPSLPTVLFDLCLVPEHDLHSGFGRLNRFSVVPTRGALNAVSSAGANDPRRAMILVGGPSRHHDWSDDEIFEQVRTIFHLSPGSIEWTVTTSLRTPCSMTQRLTGQLGNGGEGPSVNVIPCSATEPGWLAGQLQQAGTVFVSEDSISMIYESLTAGANVGLLHVPRRRRSRIVIGIDRLIADRFVVPFDEWQSTRFEDRKQEAFNEAARCAEIVARKLLPAA